MGVSKDCDSMGVRESGAKDRDRARGKIERSERGHGVEVLTITGKE